MWTRLFVKAAKGALFVLLITFQVACAGLLQPKVVTEMAQLRQGTYRVDPRHTTVLFKIDHMQLTKFVGRFNDFDATLSYDPDKPSAAKLDAIIDTASIDVNDPDFEDTLSGGSWLDSASYPQARFETTGVELLAGNKARFVGDFTLLGVTAPLVLDVVFNGGANNLLTGRYTLGFSATGSFKRSDFGMDKYIPLVGDDVGIEVHAEFQRQSD